jgi:hypothetical protein
LSRGEWSWRASFVKAVRVPAGVLPPWTRPGTPLLSCDERPERPPGLRMSACIHGVAG